MADLFVSGGIVVALETAAIAVGRLDAALAANPLRRAWTFWSELDAVRRHVEAARSTCSGSPPTSTACRSGSATALPPPSAAPRSPA
jgi:hypothetical protein